MTPLCRTYAALQAQARRAARLAASTGPPGPWAILASVPLPPALAHEEALVYEDTFVAEYNRLKEP